MNQPLALSSDERAAARAFLQRSEVRLSTMHRIGSALLSGAGILVLLPAIERDALTTIFHAIITSFGDAVRWIVALTFVVAFSMPIVAVWILLKDLTRFYFHGVHLGDEETNTDFFPRFTLTAIRFPRDELTPSNAAHLAEIRAEPAMTALLVPNNQRFREGVDERFERVRRRSASGITDAERVELLMEFAASADREILGEVVKIEYGMARHVLRTQTLVLLYAKSLIALVCTATAVFTAAAIVTSGEPASNRQLVELCAVFAWWAPATLYAISSPLRWLVRLLKHETANVALIRDDREMTRFEDIAARIAVVGWFGAALGGTLLLLLRHVGEGAPMGATFLIASGPALLAGLYRWDGTHAAARLVRRHRS